MIFRIYRTRDSWCTIQEQPCKNAFCKDYGNYNKWFIEINTLEDLKKLEKEVDNELIIRNMGCTIDESKSLYDQPYIEIYDDCRG